MSGKTEKKHSGNVELAGNPQFPSVPHFWGKLGMSGKTEYKHSGNVQLVETGDIPENGERAFWKCRAGRGNWGCLGKHRNSFRVIPSFHQFHISGGNWRYPGNLFCFPSLFAAIPSFLRQLRISRMPFLHFPGYPQFPLVPHFQNAFSLFSQTSPVSPDSTFPGETGDILETFSFSPAIPSFPWKCGQELRDLALN